jgi:hypothetical protein
MRRAADAGTGPPKKIQAWAPSPDRDRSSATGIPAARPASAYATASSGQVGPSKSHARSKQRSSRRSGYSPTCVRPVRCDSMMASVNGTYSRSGSRAFAQPPTTAGLQPALPVRAFSHRTACTSSRPANIDRKRAILAKGVECPSIDGGAPAVGAPRGRFTPALRRRFSSRSRLISRLRSSIVRSPASPTGTSCSVRAPLHTVR